MRNYLFWTFVVANLFLAMDEGGRKMQKDLIVKTFETLNSLEKYEIPTR